MPVDELKCLYAAPRLRDLKASALEAAAKDRAVISHVINDEETSRSFWRDGVRDRKIGTSLKCPA
jgi:hypothetical protein